MGGQVVNPQDNESQQEGDFKSRKVEEFLQMYAFLNFIKSLPNPSPKNNQIDWQMNHKFQIPSTKSQISTKLQIPNENQFPKSKIIRHPILQVSIIGTWNLFGIWDLVLGISFYSSRVLKTWPPCGRMISNGIIRERSGAARKPPGLFRRRGQVHRLPGEYRGRLRVCPLPQRK